MSDQPPARTAVRVAGRMIPVTRLSVDIRQERIDATTVAVMASALFRRVGRMWSDELRRQVYGHRYYGIETFVLVDRPDGRGLNKSTMEAIGSGRLRDIIAMRPELPFLRLVRREDERPD